MQPLFASGDGRTLQRLKLLRSQAHAERAPRVALRLQAVMLSLQRHTSSEIARLLQVHRTRVHSWICAWNKEGQDGLLEGHRSGRPSRLSAKQRETLYDLIESGPVAYGLNTGVWTSVLLSQVIDEEFAVQYHAGHVRKLLDQLGFSVQRPTTRLVRADPKKQNRWTRYTFPNLKKKPAPKKR